MKDRKTELLTNFIKEYIIKDKSVHINESSLLFKDRIIDSINILYLIGYVERKIGRKLKDEEIVMKNFRDIRTIVKVFFT